MITNHPFLFGLFAGIGMLVVGLIVLIFVLWVASFVVERMQK